VHKRREEMSTFEDETWEVKAPGARRPADGKGVNLEHAIFNATAGKGDRHFLVTRIEIETGNPHIKEQRVWINDTDPPPP
jgi:hypothetical protein